MVGGESVRNYKITEMHTFLEKLIGVVHVHRRVGNSHSAVARLCCGGRGR